MAGLRRQAGRRRTKYSWYAQIAIHCFPAQPEVDGGAARVEEFAVPQSEELQRAEQFMSIFHAGHVSHVSLDYAIKILSVPLTLHGQGFGRGLRDSRRSPCVAPASARQPKRGVRCPAGRHLPTRRSRSRQPALPFPLPSKGAQLRDFHAARERLVDTGQWIGRTGEQKTTGLAVPINRELDSRQQISERVVFHRELPPPTDWRRIRRGPNRQSDSSCPRQG